MATWYSYLCCGIILRTTCDAEVLITCTMIFSAKDKSYSEVARITNNFQQVIGCGAFASVYLGYLSDGTEVAVKLRSSSNRGFQSFQNEASFSILAFKLV